MKLDKAPKLWNELTLSSDKVYQLGLMVSGNKLAYNFPFICLKRWLPAVRERSCVVSSQHVCLKLLCYQCKPYLCMGEHEWPNPNHAFHVNFMNFMQNHFPTLKMKEKICANTTHISESWCLDPGKALTSRNLALPGGVAAWRCAPRRCPSSYGKKLL